MTTLKRNIPQLQIDTAARAPERRAAAAEQVITTALQGVADQPDTATDALTAAVMLATGADHPAASGVALAILAALGRPPMRTAP